MGGNCVIALPVGADAKFLTVDGDSIPALERDLKCSRKGLVAKGLDFLQDEHYVPPTATEVVLAYTQRTSKLAKMVQVTNRLHRRSIGHHGGNGRRGRSGRRRINHFRSG